MSYFTANFAIAFASSLKLFWFIQKKTLSGLLKVSSVPRMVSIIPMDCWNALFGLAFTQKPN